MDFSEYGLNKYEGKAYVALVREGNCTAPLLSKRSGVPHGKIYIVLDSLEEKGFVRVFDVFPKRFTAIEPKVVIEEALRRKEQGLKELKHKSKNLLKELGSLAGKKEQQPVEKIRSVEGYRNYLNLSVTLHDNTKHQWLTVSLLPVYQPLLDAYRRCVERGVKVKVLAHVTPSNKKNLPLWQATGAEIRTIDQLPARFCVKDDTEVTIRIVGEGKYLAMWIQSPTLAKSAEKFFGFLWAQGKKV